jgi:hypothetical protein
VTTPLPPQPKLGSIALGILVALALVVALCSASSLLKWAATPLLVVPRALGIIGSVRGQEIVAVPMATTPAVITFPHAETYAVYIGDINLLELTNQMAETDSPPWLVVQNTETGATVPVDYVQRGLLPFDEPRVPGRPVLTFEVPGPGTYVLNHPRREFDLYLVPDRVSGREGLIGLLVLVEIGLLMIPVYLVYGRRWLERRRLWRAHQRERRAATDEILRRRPAR